MGAVQLRMGALAQDGCCLTNCEGLGWVLSGSG